MRKGRWLMQKIAGIWKPKKKLRLFLGEWSSLAAAENWRDLKTQKKKLRFFLGEQSSLAASENWRDLKTPQKNKILFEGAEWKLRLMQKIGGIWKPKKNYLAGSENPIKNLRFFLRKGSWLMQKIGGIWKPKKKLRFFLADAENWRDLKTQKKFKILFGSDPNKKLRFFLGEQSSRKLAGSENPKKKLRFSDPPKKLRFFLRKGSWLMQKIDGIWKPKKIFKLLFALMFWSWISAHKISQKIININIKLCLLKSWLKPKKKTGN